MSNGNEIKWTLIRQKSGNRIGEIWELNKGTTTIGRADTNDIVSRSPFSSSQHAAITVSDENILIFDMVIIQFSVSI